MYIIIIIILSDVIYYSVQIMQFYGLFDKILVDK